MTKQTAADAWAGYVGSQTPVEFMEISRSKGLSSVEDAVAAYVADLPRMMDATFTADELADVAALLVEYINAAE